MSTLHHLPDIMTDGSKETVSHKEQAGWSFRGPPVALVHRPEAMSPFLLVLSSDALLKSRVSVASVFLEFT